jgi:hypothetical protein
MTFSLGDAGEVLAFVLIGVFVALMFAPVWALLVAAFALFYLCQRWPSVTLRKPKLRLRKPKGDV